MSDSSVVHQHPSIDRSQRDAHAGGEESDGATPLSRDRARQMARSRASSVESAWNATVSQATISLSRRNICAAPCGPYRLVRGETGAEAVAAPVGSSSCGHVTVDGYRQHRSMVS